VLPSLLAQEGGRLGSGDFLGYAPRPRSALILPRVFMLHGFWRLEFPTPLSANRIQFLAAFLPIAASAFAGLLRAVGEGRRWRAASALAASCLVSAVLGMGPSFRLTEPIARFMFENVPGYGIFREPQKWIAVLALGYAVFAAVGFQMAADGLRRMHRAAPNLVAAAVVLPLAATSTMLWAFGGRVSLTHFPEGWARVERITSDSDGSILAMPWNQYQPMALTGGRFVANPLPNYFSADVKVSGDPRLFVRDETPPADPRDGYVDALIRNSGEMERMGALLAPMGVEWVALVHDADWGFYRFLDRQKDLRVAYEDNAITLYENESYAGDTYGLRRGRPAAGLKEVLRNDPVENAVERLTAIEPPPGGGLPGVELERSWPGWREIETPDEPVVGTSRSCLDGWRLGEERPACHLGAFAAFRSTGGSTLWRQGILVQALGLALSVAAFTGVFVAIWRERAGSGRPGALGR
jgi:hypothetical protein